MKKMLLTVALAFLTQIGVSQVVYQEDFNTDDGSWIVESGIDWAWGTPAGTLINYSGNPCGGDAWVTNLTGSYSTSANAVVTSPTINCSSLGTDPVIAFDLFYDTESCCDEVWMEFSLDDGGSWTKLTDAGSATGWYNDTFNQWWDGTNGDWTTVSNVIPGAAGVATVKVRVVFNSDFSVSYEGVGFDNVLVTDNYVSATMNGVTNISTGLVLTASENIEVSITNNGSVDISGLDVCYVLDGGTPVCETIGAPVTPGVNTYTFTATEDFSATGTYTIQSYISGLTEDVNLCDDTSLVVVDLIEPIDTYPYVQNFESGSGGFIVEGDWEIGEPIDGSDFDNTLACPEDLTVLGTVINGNYSNGIVADYAYSPIFDFSSFTSDPFVFFDIFRNTENNYDEGWVESSIDGTTWVKVGTAGTGLNWYNDAGNQWWEDLSGGWVYAYHELIGLAGESSVQFRFVLSTDGSVSRPGIAIDNFTIQQEQPIIVDASPVALTSPVFATCGFTTNDLIAGDFTNFGSDSLFGYTLCYDAGAGSVCETFTDTILPGATISHTFLTPVDLTGSLSHDIALSITNGADLRPCNDTVVYNIVATVEGLASDEIITDISCNGETDGEIFVNPMNGTPGYSVSWDSGDTGFILDSLDAGFHTYTIMDANGCMFTDSAEVMEPDAIVLSTVVTDETVTGNGEIDLTVTGGTSPYTYDWDNDGTGDFDGEDVTGLEGGTYTVIVVDANGCTETTSATVISYLGLGDLGNQFSVFPNPTTGSFQIIMEGSNGAYSLNIFDLLGKVVYTDVVNSNVTLVDIENLESGTYLVELSNETERETVRLVIK